jgi:large subunit ribosomal protein L14e
VAINLLRLGQLVSSKIGRDCNRSYLVIKKLDDRFVLLADGHRRKVLNPKKKNLRHLVIHRAVAEDIAEKLALGELVTDEEIYAALVKFKKKP